MNVHHQQFQNHDVNKEELQNKFEDNDVISDDKTEINDKFKQQINKNEIFLSVDKMIRNRVGVIFSKIYFARILISVIPSYFQRSYPMINKKMFLQITS